MSVFRKLPRYAFRCKINGWTTAENFMSLDHKRVEEFKESLSEKKQLANVDIIESKENELDFYTDYEVRLLINGVNFVQHFQKKASNES